MACKHHLKIANLGPIDKAELDIGKFIVLTGPQANGKSTVAKAVFFFRTIKDDILELTMSQLPSETRSEKRDLKHDIKLRLRNKFMDLFGSTYAMPINTEMMYSFDGKDSFVRVFLKQDYHGSDKKYIEIEYGDIISAVIEDAIAYAVPLGKTEITRLKSQLAKVFNDESETYFVPAGRSTITLLSEQLSFIFNSFEQWQLRTIDFATRNFVELILKVKPWFSESRNATRESESDAPLTSVINSYSQKIIQASYRFINSEERLYLLDNERNYVKINLSSSGQQEAVWILNLINYFYSENKKIFLILEEPEAHLYPDSQMNMADVLSLFLNIKGNAGLVTTHSPYILGELNNLVLCGQVQKENENKAKEIIDKCAWIKDTALSAYHVYGGTLKKAVSGSGLIMNELIDGASAEINNRCDSIIALLPEETET
jgi:predicted ATP-dependent endonuclease of OLD family